MNFSFFLQENGQGPSNPKSSSTSKYVVTDTLHDRTILSDEMADLCAKFPIYVIKKEHLLVGVEKESKWDCDYLKQKNLEYQLLRTKDNDENDVLFSEWHMHTFEKGNPSAPIRSRT